MNRIFLVLITTLVLAYPGVAISESSGKDPLVNEIRIGIMEHDVASRSTKHEDGQDFNSEFFFRSPSYRWVRFLGSPRPSAGLSINSNENTSLLYAGLNWDVRFIERLFFTLGLGGAIHDGELQSTDPDEQRLGSRALFRIGLAAGFNFSERMNISALFNHCSNGHTAYPNNGMEQLGVQFGYTY